MQFREATVAIAVDRFHVCACCDRVRAAMKQGNGMRTGERCCDEMPSEKSGTAED